MGLARNSICDLLRSRPENGGVRGAYARFAAFLRVPVPEEEAGSQELHFRAELLQLLRLFLSRVPEEQEKREEKFRNFLADEYTPAETAHLLREMQELSPVSSPQAAQLLGAMSPEQRSAVLEFLLRLIVEWGHPRSDLEFAAALARESGMPDGEFCEMRDRLLAEAERRKKILRSGAGVLVAVGVIAVFLITATLLRSVIFGLILAYLLLPLEKHYEKQHRKRAGFSFYLFHFFALWSIPLHKLSRCLMRRDPESASGEDAAKRKERNIIKKAVLQTVLTAVLLVAVLGIFLGTQTGRYVDNLKDSVHSWRAQHQLVMPAGGNTTLQQLTMRIEQLRVRFEKLPPVQAGLDKVEKLLNSESARNEFIAALLRRSGGFFSFTAGVVGTVISLLCDLLLTVFFALLFLTKLAEFCRNDDSSGRRSEYLVRTVFNGKWLPEAGDDVIREANRIISGVMTRLQIWVKGYLLLVLVDSSVYCTVFFFLGVPYFPLLGLLAGCGILLPYIGPVVSCCVTLLVTLAAGHSSGVLLLQIIGSYLLYNGIVEQFILYPAVIGESLGLTTLETIIVVLLGAIFAGIPGMLFALPAASVLKFLVPQIYRCWERER